MQPPPYRSTARAILIVGVLLALVPGIIPEVRANGTLEFAHAWTWTAIIAVAALAPYAAVFVLSSPTQSETRRQVARGIALWTPLAAFLVLGLSLLTALYLLLFGGHAVLTVQIASCILLIALNALMLWGALAAGGKAGGMVLAGIAAAFVFVSLGTRAVMRVEASAANGVQTYHRDIYAAEQTAIGVLRQLAACASTYRMSHGAQLPSNLAGLISMTGCDAALASPSAVPMYAIAVDVTPADTVNPGATVGCQFTATFTGKLLGDRAQRSDGRTLWSTCAGHLYARELGQAAGEYLRVSPGFPSEMNVLFNNVVRTANEAGGRIPARLSELLSAPHLQNRRYVYDANILIAQQRADLDSNVFRSGGYVARYVPGTSDFHIDVRCETYGPACMRAYFVEASGVVHATGEPRAARATDPLAEHCEFATVPCDAKPGSLSRPRAESDTL
jgi:hypothetical protein